MFRGKSWFSGGMWKPRNPHSLEHLKYLYHVLSKNQSVNEQNKSLLVETLRSIAEILIWGDQNDSTVFDFFLEKNMLSFFLKIMKQKCGRYVCVQLLQTLNILFENIRNETSLYYLLSNNHVNSIIVHKFDFSDEEVMAYYISFLKTLSLKLNTHTIHFFYNEHTNDFPLYTEAIKFFNHSESMVRIAVRTLTLNVFKVDDKAMLKFIRNKTAAPYFSNLVWFIGKHVLELEQCVQSYSGLQIHTKLSDLVAEHLDHLHYLNDILCLQIDALNDVLTDHLLNRLLVPLYVYSLTQHEGVSFSEEGKPHVSSVVSLFLLSQVFLIISHQPLVCQLAHIILNGDMSLFSGGVRNVLSSLKNEARSEPEFVAPEESLEKSLETTIKSRFSSHSISRNGKIDNSIPPSEEVTISHDHNESQCREGSTINSMEEYNFNEGVARCIPTISEEAPSDISLATVAGANITDEEKAVAAEKLLKLNHMQLNFTLAERPFLEAVFEALDCTDSDHSALFALCLLYALGHNPGINQDLLDTVLMPSDKSETKLCYNVNLIERMIQIINLSCQYNSKVRMATLQMDILLLKQMVIKDVNSFLQDRHLAAIEQYREESSLMLRNFYKNDDIFLDMFEDEYEEMKKKPLNVEYLMMDANLLLPPMGTPMSGVEFHKRLPCGENERARRAIHVFFLLRDLSLSLRNEPESQLPLTDLSTCIKVNDVLDLTNSDLIFCTVVTKDGQKVKRFMVIDTLQLVLVEPDPKRHGWGVAKFVGFLQDIEVTGDSDDSRCLHITVHRPPNIAAGSNRLPLLVARFIVDDHIRCMAAKQRLTKGRKKARQRKMHQIASLLDLPEHIQPCPSPLRHGLRTSKDVDHSFAMHRSQSQDTGLRGKTMSPSGSRPGQYGHRPIFSPGSKVPGYATILKQDEKVFSEPGIEFTGKDNITLERKRASSSPITSRRSTSRSRESSPRQRTGSNSEEIPLEDLSRGRGSRHNSPNIRRQSSPGLPHARISAPPGMYHVHHLFTPNQSRKVATTTNLSEIVKNHEKEKKLPCRMSITSDEIFFDEGVRPSPKTLRPADTPHLTLVLDAEQGTDVLPISPLLLPFHDQMSMETIDDSNGGSSNSPPDKVCTKPCCALERSHEKLDLENYHTSIGDYQGGRADNILDQDHSDKEANEVITSVGAESSCSDACSFLNVEMELHEKSLTTQKPSAASASSSAVKTKGSIQTV